MNLQDFNQLDKEKAQAILAAACGSLTWQNAMMQVFPFKDEVSLVKNAADAWYYACNQNDWLEAFTHHPKIGDVESLAKKFPTTQELAGAEQSGVNKANAEVIEQLAKANDLYHAKFGFIFIVFATGKSAEQMLRILQDRSSNQFDEELIIAAGEQLKITIQRFKSLLPNANWTGVPVSQITSHVLDTASGHPAKNLTIRLKHFVSQQWQTLAQGITNDDGRVADFLPSCKPLVPGNYKVIFETLAYFEDQNIATFFPDVTVHFSVNDEAHYHIPLLLSPYGYSTYRGS